MIDLWPLIVRKSTYRNYSALMGRWPKGCKTYRNMNLLSINGVHGDTRGQKKNPTSYGYFEQIKLKLRLLAHVESGEASCMYDTEVISPPLPERGPPAPSGACNHVC